MTYEYEKFKKYNIIIEKKRQSELRFNINKLVIHLVDTAL